MKLFKSWQRRRHIHVSDDDEFWRKTPRMPPHSRLMLVGDGRPPGHDGRMARYAPRSAQFTGEGRDPVHAETTHLSDGRLGADLRRHNGVCYSCSRARSLRGAAGNGDSGVRRRDDLQLVPQNHRERGQCLDGRTRRKLLLQSLLAGSAAAGFRRNLRKSSTMIGIRSGPDQDIGLPGFELLCHDRALEQKRARKQGRECSRRAALRVLNRASKKTSIATTKCRPTEAGVEG